MGTAAYMSPEQARGEPVDKRTDIWAFGVVLYEMLTGSSMFGGKTVSDILAAVLVTEPDLSKVPPKVRRLLRRCLEKDARKRLRDIGDAMPLVDEDISRALAGRPSPAPWIAAGLLAIVAAMAGIGWWRRMQPVEQPQVRVDVDLGTDVALRTPPGSSHLIISPDGARLVYLASVAGGQPKLYVRNLDQPRATELPGTQDAYSPFFSPDSQWVGFGAAGKLYKVPLDGGAAVPVGMSDSSAGGAWTDGGSIVTAPLLKGLLQFPSTGGAPTTIAKLAEGEFSFSRPQLLPGGKAILVSCFPSPRADQTRVEVISRADGRRTIVIPRGSSARYLAITKSLGYLLYTERNRLLAVPFEPDRIEKRGDPVPVLDDVGFHTVWMRSSIFRVPELWSTAKPLIPRRRPSA